MPHTPDHSLSSITCGSGQFHPPVSSSVAPSPGPQVSLSSSVAPSPCPQVPLSSSVPLSSPPHSLAAVEALALRAEAQLNRWFDATPDPTLDQLSVASQAIWRIAAVHKTVLFAANPPAYPSGSGPGSGPGPRRKGKDPDAEFFRAMNARMSEVDQYLAQLLPPPAPKRPAAPAPAQAPAPAPEFSSAAAPAPAQPAGNPANPSAPASDEAALSEPAEEAIAILKSMGIHVPDYEDIPILPDLPACAELPDCAELGAIPQIRAIGVIPRLRYRAPKPDTPAPADPAPAALSAPEDSPAAPANSSATDPEPLPPVCPTLRAPLHTARAALRQANRLCKEAGLPAETLSLPVASESPSPSPSPSPSQSELKSPSCSCSCSQSQSTPSIESIPSTSSPHNPHSAIINPQSPLTPPAFTPDRSPPD